jgi:hypothetical protein
MKERRSGNNISGKEAKCHVPEKGARSRPFLPIYEQLFLASLAGEDEVPRILQIRIIL